LHCRRFVSHRKLCPRASFTEVGSVEGSCESLANISITVICGSGMSCPCGNECKADHNSQAFQDNRRQPDIMKQHFISRDTTVHELEPKAAEAEQEAANAPEPRAGYGLRLGQLRRQLRCKYDGTLHVDRSIWRKTRRSPDPQQVRFLFAESNSRFDSRTSFSSTLP